MRWSVEPRDGQLTCLLSSAPSPRCSKDEVEIARNPYSAAKDAHAICVLTEWDEFKTLDYQVGLGGVGLCFASPRLPLEEAAGPCRTSCWPC